MSAHQLQEAAAQLLARCDGARERDGTGFSKYDRAFGEDLATSDPSAWSPGRVRTAYRLLRKYRKQLDRYGIDFDEIKQPEPPPATTSKTPDATRHISFDRGCFNITFTYDPEVVNDLKKTFASGRRFDYDTKTWYVSQEHAGLVATFATRWSFTVTDNALSRLATPTSPRRISLAGRNLLIHFPFDPALVRIVKEVPGATFEKTPVGHWRAPLSYLSAEGIFRLAQHDFELEEGVAEALLDDAENASRSMQQSRAATSDFDVEGLKGTLFPFQRAGVEYALSHKKVIIGDEMGLGKTAMALATIHHTQSYPALVLCPASVKLNWAREVHNWLPDKSVGILEGRTTGEGSTTTVRSWHGPSLVYVNHLNVDVLVLNYDLAVDHVEKLSTIAWKAVVADESHYLKNPKAKRSKACARLLTRAPYRLLLSGTPIKSRPLEYLHQLKILGMVNKTGTHAPLGKEWSFLTRYCDGHRTRFGWDFNGASNIDELNQKLRATCMISRTKAQVMKELPPLRWATVPLAINNRNEYSKAAQATPQYIYEMAKNDPEVRGEVMRLLKSDYPGMSFEAILEHLARDKRERARRAEHLVRIAVLRKLAAVGKLDDVKTWIEDFLESGEKLIVFAVHVSIQKELLATFPTAAHVFGEDSSTQRHEQITRFQEDPDCRLIIASLYAGSEGITLTAASNVAFVQQGWTPAEMDQAAARAHRIGQEASSVTAWMLLASATVEESLDELLAKKRAVLRRAITGDAHKEDLTTVINQISQLT